MEKRKKTKLKFKVGDYLTDGYIDLYVLKIRKTDYILGWANTMRGSFDFKWAHKYLKNKNSSLIRKKLGIK